MITANTCRTFKRYRYYYGLLQDYPRLKHSTISFRTLRDITISIRNWFNSEECIALPVTDTTSASFWRNEPTSFHTFDTITVINDNPDNEESDSEKDSSSDDDSETNEEDLLDDDFYNGRPVDICLYRKINSKLPQNGKFTIKISIKAKIAPFAIIHTKQVKKLLPCLVDIIIILIALKLG